MILESWPAFRFAFADRVESTGSFTFDDGTTPHRITRGAGSFVSDGFEVGMTVDPIGTVDNGYRYTISAVAAGALSLATTDVVNPEGPVSCTLVGAHRDDDGVEQWPTALVRSGGFTGGFTGIAKPILQPIVSISVNAQALDAVSGTDEYDWYVSQRTSTIANRLLKVWDYHHYFATAATRSGTIVITLSNLGVSRLGVASTFSFISVDQVIRTFRNAIVFCRRKSDGAIQYVDVLRYTLG